MPKAHGHHASSAIYRPNSNLPYASKLLERHFSAQLRLHLQHNSIGDPFQSTYRPSHRMETAIVCIQDDILRSLDARKHVVLLLFDCVRYDRRTNLHFAGLRPISPTEHSESVLMVIFPATSNCDMEFHRAVFWALSSSFLSTVQIFQKSS